MDEQVTVESFDVLPIGSLLPDTPSLRWRRNNKITFKGFFMCTVGVIIASSSPKHKEWMVSIHNGRSKMNGVHIFVQPTKPADTLVYANRNGVTSYLTSSHHDIFTMDFSSLKFKNKTPYLWYLAHGRILTKIKIENHWDCTKLTKTINEFECIHDVTFWNYYDICHEALLSSHIPYQPSAACGVVVIANNNKYYTGSTVQNCAYPSSICALQAAVAISISNGIKAINGILILGVSRETPKICGSCLEFARILGDVPLFFFSQREISSRASATDLPSDMCLISELLVHRSLDYNQKTQNDDYKIIRNYKPLSLELHEIPEFKDIQMESLELLNSAVQASSTAVPIISQFPVGAAIQTDKGIFTGSNVEHKVIRLGLCAERVALCNAIANGAKEIKRVAVYCHNLTDDDDFGTPCGACRQTLAEFGNLELYFIKRTKDYYKVLEKRLFSILVYPFTPVNLLN